MAVATRRSATSRDPRHEIITVELSNLGTLHITVSFQPLVYYVTLRRACRLVIKSLSEETDWNVLQLVLAKVPTVLQNRAIITR